jgi:hypothetical protein
MNKTYVLLDFENAQNHDLGVLREGDCRVFLFYGPHQNKFPVTFTKALLPLGERVELIQIDQQAKEALDFHIAFYLGRLVRDDPHAKFLIVSADKGFEPLVRHTRGLGYDIEQIPVVGHPQGVKSNSAAAVSTPRANGAPETPTAPITVPKVAKKATSGASNPPAASTTAAKKLAPATSKAKRTKLDADDRAKLVENLQKVSTKRPQKRATLIRHIVTLFGNTITDQVAEKLVKQLEAEGQLAFEQSKVVYRLRKVPTSAGSSTK